jgi:co-chaperonin GroES (HSP10)
MKPVTPGHRVLVKPIKLEEADKAVASAKAAGLLILDKTQRQESTIIDVGTVVQIGPTAFRDFGGDPWCKVGDTISYTRHGGKFVKDPDSDEEWLVLNDEDVVMVWEK